MARKKKEEIKEEIKEAMMEDMPEINDDFDEDSVEITEEIPDIPDDFSQENAVMDETATEKFNEKLQGFLKIAKKKKLIDYNEVLTYFADINLNDDQIDGVLEFLDQKGIAVVRMSDEEEDDEEDIILTEEDEVDVENIDLSVPEGVSIEDPVRMYLKEIILTLSNLSAYE